MDQRTALALKEANKIVPVFACLEAKPRCLVYLLHTYFEKCPPQAAEMDVFYLHPNSSSGSVWYDYVPVGRYTEKIYRKNVS